MLAEGFTRDFVYQAAILSYIHDNQFQRAAQLDSELESQFEKDSTDYANSGIVKMHLERYQEALADFDRALEIDPTNLYAWNNRGYTYTLLEDYQKALPDFEEAIKLDNSYPYPYNNRGLSKIKLGQTEDGLADIMTSLQLYEDNAYGFRNLGIYYFDQGEDQQALSNFQKALQLDSHTHLAEKYINLIHEKVKISS